MKLRFCFDDEKDFQARARLVTEKEGRRLVLKINEYNVLEIFEDGRISTNFSTVNGGIKDAGSIKFLLEEEA